MAFQEPKPLFTIKLKDGFSHLLTIAQTRVKYDESMDSVSPIRTLSQKSTGGAKASTISKYDRDDRDVIGIENRGVQEDNDRDDRDDRVILRSHYEGNDENRVDNGGNPLYTIENESIPINSITPKDIPDEIRKLHPLHPDYETTEENDDD